MNIISHVYGDSAVLDPILNQQLQNLLAGAENILSTLVTDYTGMVGPGMDRVHIPKFSRLSTSKPVDGTDGSAQSGGFDTSVITLLLNSPCDVEHFFGEKEMRESALDKVAAFWFGAIPELIIKKETLIARHLEQPFLATGSGAQKGNDFTSSAAATGNNRNGEYVFNVKDVAKAKAALDKAGVSKLNRYGVVNADQMEQMASWSEFQDGAKSLSAEALRQGIVSQVKGFSIVQCEVMGQALVANGYQALLSTGPDVENPNYDPNYSTAHTAAIAANQLITFFQKEACGIAISKEITRDVEEQKSKKRIYVRASMVMGAKLLDQYRKVTIFGKLQTGA